MLPKGVRRLLVVTCCLDRIGILFVVVRLCFATNGMMVSAERSVMFFIMLFVSLGSLCSVSPRVCTRVLILALQTSLCPAPAKPGECDRALDFIVVNPRYDHALESCSDKGALVASALAEKSKLEDHEKIVIKYGYYGISSHHLVHYKKGAKVLIIRKILTCNMYHDTNF